MMTSVTYLNDLTRSYRITEAIEMFKNPNHDRKTILEILYDVGFNSKSSFNHVFKKKTGETPSKFRRALKYNEASKA